jgi:RimJ/RimL family protein N-acetyltransferase
VVRHGDRVLRWAGTRRRRRPAAWVRDPGALDDGAPVLLDGDGAVVLALAPLAVVAAPAPGSEPELFVIDRGEPGGAVLVTFPDGFEYRDDPWPALAAALPPAGDAATAADDERCPYRGLEPFGTGDADEMLSRDREHWKLFGYGPWVLEERAGGPMIGRGGIQWVDLDGGRAAELPWTIASAHWGRGLATEAAAAAVEWARSLDLPGVIALVGEDNPASRRVAEKAGLLFQTETSRAGLPHVVYGLTFEPVA